MNEFELYMYWLGVHRRTGATHSYWYFIRKFNRQANFRLSVITYIKSIRRTHVSERMYQCEVLTSHHNQLALIG